MMRVIVDKAVTEKPPCTFGTLQLHGSDYLGVFGVQAGLPVIIGSAISPAIRNTEAEP